MGCGSSSDVKAQESTKCSQTQHKDSKAQIINYTISVFTTKKETWNTAGTDVDVYLTIQGDKGKSDGVKLDILHKDDLEAGRKDTYKTKAKDIGNILYLFIERKGGDDWHLDKIEILESSSNANIIFPFYGWVPQTVKIRVGNALLPFQETNSRLKQQRQEQLENRKQLYQFIEDTEGLPGFVKQNDKTEGLPRDVKFSDAKGSDLQSSAASTIVKFGLSYFLEALDTWNHPKEHIEIAERFIKEEDLTIIHQVMGEYESDPEFGRQMLNGVNPTAIRRCMSLPDHFPVTNEIVKPYLCRGVTLQEEMKNGYIYITSYEEVKGLNAYNQDDDKRYCADATCLVYVRPSEELVPIAIKLELDPSSPIWVPDDKLGWLLAKLHVKNTDAQVHQMHSHLLMTHLAMEAVALTMLRNVPSVHPIFKLLWPHTRYTIAINTSARNTLMPPGGVLDKGMSLGGGGHIDLLKKSFQTKFTWSDYNIPRTFAKRGIDCKDKLPNFFYRDDALLMWTAIHNFVKNTMDIYYKSDVEVGKDVELQAWLEESHVKAFPQTAGSVNHDFPISIKTREELYDFLTGIIFNVSCQHAAVNYSQFHYYAFPTNRPLILRQSPLKEKRNISIDDVVAALPNKKQTAIAAVFMHIFATFSEEEIFLGHYPEEHFVEAGAKKAMEKFRQELKEISQKIHKRNENLPFKYTYLLPENIPSSIVI